MSPIVGGPPDDTPFGARLRDIVACGATGRARGPRFGRDPAGGPPRTTASSWRRRRLTPASPSPTTASRPTWWRSRVRRGAARTCRSCRRTTRCRAGWRRSPGYTVRDLRRRWRLGFDIDGPLDLVLLGVRSGSRAGVDLARGRERLAAVRARRRRRRAELVVAGRVSAAALTWLERRRAARVAGDRRGARPAGGLALAQARATGDATSRRTGAAAGVLLGALLDREGPGALGEILGRLGDAAIVDTRVLLAHRLGADETAWPATRGPVRLRPPAARADPRPLAAELTASAARGIRCRSSSGDIRSSVRAPGSCGTRPHAADAVELSPGLRRDAGARPGRGRRDEALAERIHDEIERDGPDHLRPVHGARALRPGRRLLPGGDRAARTGRRLPDRAGDTSDLRCGARSRPDRGLGTARAARSVRAPRAWRRDRSAGRWPSSTGSRSIGPGSRTRSRYDPIEIEPRRLETIAARLGAAGRRAVLVDPARAADRSSGRSSRTRSSTRCRRIGSCPRRASARDPDRIARRAVRRHRRRAVDAGAGRAPGGRGRHARRGQRAEVCLAVDDWVAGAAAGLERGVCAADRLRPSRRGALRPGAAARWDAPCLREATGRTTTRTGTWEGRT